MADFVQVDPFDISEAVPTNALVAEGSVGFTDGEGAGTGRVISVGQPGEFQVDSRYAITVVNLSSSVDITVIARNRETIGGAPRMAEVTRFGVPANSPNGRVFVVQGWLLGDGPGQLEIRNDYTVGGGGGFQVHVRARKL